MKNINILNNLNSGKTSSYFTTNGTKEFTCNNAGYVDNVVIEGETLVNLIRTNSSVEVWDNSKVAINLQVCNYLEGTYTLFNFSDKTIILDIGEATTNNWLRTFALEKNKVKTFNIHNGERIFNVNGLFTGGWENNDTSKNEFRNSIVLLEGDHTDKPISYFEGLKSVGQGDKIEVLSLTDNLFSKDDFVVGSTNSIVGDKFVIDSKANRITHRTPIPVQMYEYLVLDYANNVKAVLYELDSNDNILKTYGWSKYSYARAITPNTKYIRIIFSYDDDRDMSLDDYDMIKPFLTNKHDKKQISTTLRSLPNEVKDTIEKRGNKYVKVQRCGEYTFTGGESFEYLDGATTYIQANIFVPFTLAPTIINDKTPIGNIVCNILPDNGNVAGCETIFRHPNKANVIVTRISSSKVTSNETDYLKYLKDNLTIVYELETPIVTELPNFNPQTYKGKNTLIINSGVIQCDASFDVCEGIRSELDVIKYKVSSLDDNVKNSLGSEISNEINTIKNTVNNNTNNIGNLTTKVNNGQNYKLTEDNGGSKFVDGGTFDDIKTTGIYTCSSNVGGAKPNPNYGGYYHLEVINADASNNIWITQRATIFEGTGHGIQVYTRICQYGTWTHWGRNIVDGQATRMTEENGACRGIPNNNANDIDITGFWMGSNVVNAPTGIVGEWIYIESLVHNSLYQVQKATDLHDSSKRWTRHKTGGNWSEWRSL